MIKTICAIILLGLIAYSLVRKAIARIGGEQMKCAGCGRTIGERSIKKEINGKELVFCCEHCAMAYASHNKKK
jgi:hypothetical protein